MQRTLPVLAALLLLALAAPTAAAHASKTSADGKIRVTWGFHDEPAVTGQKLRLDLIIRDNATMTGIGGLNTTDITSLSLHLGDQAYDFGDLTAFRGAKTGGFAGDGNYTGQHAVWLTQPGVYALRIKGTIQGSEIDLEIPASHEYHAAHDIMFPKGAAHGGMPGDASALEARIAALEAKVTALEAEARTASETPATVTPQVSPKGPIPAGGVALAALAAVAVAFALRRRA